MQESDSLDKRLRASHCPTLCAADRVCPEDMGRVGWKSFWVARKSWPSAMLLTLAIRRLVKFLVIIVLLFDTQTVKRGNGE